MSLTEFTTFLALFSFVMQNFFLLSLEKKLTETESRHKISRWCESDPVYQVELEGLQNFTRSQCIGQMLPHARDCKFLRYLQRKHPGDFFRFVALPINPSCCTSNSMDWEYSLHALFAREQLCIMSLILSGDPQQGFSHAESGAIINHYLCEYMQLVCFPLPELSETQAKE